MNLKKNLLIILLLVIATTASAQSQTPQKESKATNAAQALESFQWMNAKVDTMNHEEDTLKAYYEKRIEKMLNDQKKREAKKPD